MANPERGTKQATYKNRIMNDELNDEFYVELLKSLLPRPIHSQEQYDKVQRQIDILIDKGYLLEDERDYLILLGLLIKDYEDRKGILIDE